jgi:magnesium transporter
VHSAFPSRLLAATRWERTGVVSNNVNAVVRVLTLVTVLLAIPTWLTGLFGMNLAIPGQHQPWMFATVIILNVSAVALLWFMLRRRKWL